MSPDVRVNNPPLQENNWFYVKRPKRTPKQPSEEWEQAWISRTDVNWASFAKTAYSILSSQKDAVLKPDLLTEDTAGDAFRFKRSDIAVHIVNIDFPKEIKNIFAYFEVGRELEPAHQGTQHVEKVYEVTRAELFQIFVIALARKNIKGARTKRGRSKQMARVRERNAPVGDIYKLRHEINRVEPMPIGESTSEEIIIVEPAKIEQSILKTVSQEAVFRPRPRITDFETKEEIDRLMRRKPERGGPMMNVK